MSAETRSARAKKAEWFIREPIAPKVRRRDHGMNQKEAAKTAAEITAMANAKSISSVESGRFKVSAIILPPLAP